MADYPALLRDHVMLTCRSIDRIFLLAYLPKPRTVGCAGSCAGSGAFETASSAAFGCIGDAYVKAIHASRARTRSRSPGR